MYVSLRLGSLVRLLVLIAVVAGLIGALIAGGAPERGGPDVVPPPTPQTTQNLAPLGESLGSHTRSG